jgi:hypothetical protein
MSTMLELTEIGYGSRVLINDSCNSKRDDLLLDIISSISSNNKLKSITVITTGKDKDRIAFYNQRVPEAQCHTEFKKVTLTGLYASQCSEITQAKQAGFGAETRAVEPVMLILDSGIMLDEFLATKVSKDILANTKRLGFILVMLDERPAKLSLAGGTTLSSWPENIAEYIYYPSNRDNARDNKYYVLTDLDKPWHCLKYYIAGHDFEMAELDSSITTTRPSQSLPAIIIIESEIEPAPEQQVTKETEAEQQIEDNKNEDSAINASNATPAVTQQATSSGGLLSGLWWLLGY